MTVLDQTPKWQDQWSRQLLKVIQAYDRELSEHCKEEAAWNEACQKRAKHEQDQARFAEESRENAEHIRQEVLCLHMAATGRALPGLEAPMDIRK